MALDNRDGEDLEDGPSLPNSYHQRRPDGSHDPAGVVLN